MPRASSGDKSFCARVWGRLLAFSRENDLLEPGDLVLVGVSGGPDSVCLLHFLKNMERRWGLSVTACHVHHGLRGAAADRDEKFVQKLCAKLDVPLFSARVKAGQHARAHNLSLEHAARQLRYQAFASCAKTLGAGKVAVAHHMDDQVETVLLHLLRGSSFEGLAGMPVKRPLAAGRKTLLVRPLMCLSRAEVLDYIRRNKLSFVRDESNDCDRHTRNWIRKKLLPLVETRQPRFRQHMLELSRKITERLS